MKGKKKNEYDVMFGGVKRLKRAKAEDKASATRGQEVRPWEKGTRGYVLS